MVLGAYCDRLGHDVLIWFSSILAVDNNDDGIVVTYRCACGDLARMVTGAKVEMETTRHLAA